MGLGRKRARAELLEALRTELEMARSETRAALDDVVADVERRLQSRLDSRDRTATTVASQLGDMGSELGARVAQFERALETVAETCDLAVRTVQTNRVERLALLDAIEELAARLPAAVPPASTSGGAGLKVVGGTVGSEREEESPGHEAEATAQRNVMEIPAAHPAGASRQGIRLDGVEARCRV